MDLEQFTSYLITEGTASLSLSSESCSSAGMSLIESRGDTSSFLLGSSLAPSKETKGELPNECQASQMEDAKGGVGGMGAETHWIGTAECDETSRQQLMMED